MSTISLLFHAFGVKDFELQKTEYAQGETRFFLHHKRFKLRCSVCRASKVKLRGYRERKIRSVPIGTTPTFFLFRHQRLECLECGAIRYVKVNFVDKNKQYSSVPVG